MRRDARIASSDFLKIVSVRSRARHALDVIGASRRSFASAVATTPSRSAPFCSWSSSQVNLIERIAAHSIRLRCRSHTVAFCAPDVIAINRDRLRDRRLGCLAVAAVIRGGNEWRRRKPRRAVAF